MKNVLALATATLLVGCASQGVLTRGEAKAGCASLAGTAIGAATVESATLVEAAPLSVAERGPTPAATINPATPQYCKVLGAIAPVDPKAPPIKFEVNLPTAWNGRSVQYGGGGFNGVLITASASCLRRPMTGRHRWRRASSPSARIRVTRTSRTCRRRPSLSTTRRSSTSRTRRTRRSATSRWN